MKLLNEIYRVLFGYDFFISYSRKDSSKYAGELANQIIDKKFSCFIDQLGSEPGIKIPRSLIRKIKGCSVLIILGTNEACISENIQDEIRAFLPTKRVIVPVDFGNINNAVWFSEIRGIALTSVSIDELQKANISASLLSRIFKSHKYVKQSRRIMISAIMASFFIILAFFVVGIVWFQSKDLTKQIKVKTGLIEEKEVQLKTISHTVDSIKSDLNVKSQQLTDANNKIVFAEKYADSIKNIANEYLSIAQERQASSFKLLRFVEDGIEGLYPQPLLKECQFLLSDHVLPVTLHVYLDKYTISERSKILLDSVITCLKNNHSNNIEILLFGHTSRYNWLNKEAEITGNEDAGAHDLTDITFAYSFKISDQMTRIVLSYLDSNGIDGKNITVKSYGKSNPKYSLDFMNNRIELFILNR